MIKKKRHIKKKKLAPQYFTWSNRLQKIVRRIAMQNRSSTPYLSANCDAVHRTVDGRGPESDAPHPCAGARITFNISSVHVPGFCKESSVRNSSAYKNCYDLQFQFPLNSAHVSVRRKMVDNSLPLPSGACIEKIYFGAVDVNGGGVRFYGDVCLVLERKYAESCIVLDRNSYDLVRSPVKELVAQAQEQEQPSLRQTIARSWSGTWTDDLKHIATAKALATLAAANRRWTTGHISYAICSDEDYIEVLKPHSFDAQDLQEARFSANDIAEDALTTTRLAVYRSVPRLESLLWARRRVIAEAALRSMGVPVRIVSSHGRVKM